jgi:hypothetical protein
VPPISPRLLVASVVVTLSASGGWAFAHRGEPAAPLPARTPVVVELFSSEGCSSCPPADDYLARHDRTQPVDGVTVIALEEHVDYWDRLGWKDPFGQAQFGERQRTYAQALPDHRVFTPEIVIDGHAVMEGGDEDGARALMRASAAEPKAKVRLTHSAMRVAIDVTDVPPSAADDPTDVWLAVTESGLASDVPRGENAGRTLEHAPVVRALRVVGRVANGAFHGDAAVDSDMAWKARALRTVVFVQRAKSRRIVGAGAICASRHRATRADGALTRRPRAVRFRRARGRGGVARSEVDHGWDCANQSPGPLRSSSLTGPPVAFDGASRRAREARSVMLFSIARAIPGSSPTEEPVGTRAAWGAVLHATSR